MAQLTEVKIKNYRSIKDSGIVAPVTKIFALIGQNNTGKSSFLKAIQVLFCERNIDLSDFHKGTRDDIEIVGTLEKWTPEEKKVFNLKITCGPDMKPKYFLNNEDVRVAEYKKVIPALLSIPDIRDNDEFSTAGQKTTILKRLIVARKQTDAEGVDELAQLTERMEVLKKKEAEDVSRILTKKFCDITQEKTFTISINPDVNLEKGVTHESTLTDTDVPGAQAVNVKELGTGLQSMYLLTLLETYGDISGKSDEAILIIEEPEVYLHPEYQRRMFHAIREIASENQVIFSSHSPIMVAEIWLTESVRQVRLEIGESHIEPVRIEDVISELGIKYEDVLNPRLIIFVEGENDIKFYQKLGLQPNKKVAFIATDGFRAVHYFAYIKIISSENVESTFISVVDGDGEECNNRKKDLQEKIRKQFKYFTDRMEERIGDNRIFVLGKYSIESYLLNIQTLSKAFPRIERAKLEKFLSHYWDVYNEEKGKITDKNTFHTFQKYARPKLLFDNSRKGETNSRFVEGYRKFWRKDENFLAIRDELVQVCAGIGQGGGSWFDHVLEHTNLDDHQELVEIRSRVLTLLES